MSVPHVSSSEISNKILEIFRNNSNTRSGRIDTLEQISELAKGIIDNLNVMDDSVYEITDEFDSCIEEYERLTQEMDKANAEIEKYDGINTLLGGEIALLEEKEENGTITEDEATKLEDLRERQQSYQNKSNSVAGNLESLNNSSNLLNTKISGFSEELEDITSSMEEYQKAGTVIKDSANKYGKKNMDVEKAMDRNESSWWGNAAKYSGIGVIGGTVAAIGGAQVGIGVGNIADNFVVGGKIVGAIAGGVIGIGSGIALGSMFGQGKQMQKYLDKAGYTEIGDNTQVFYDAINHDYIAEYDVLEKKGGNKIHGKMRKATAKTFSYGKTIEVASENIKQTAGQAESKIKKQE